jgi:hypothetical protein
MRARPSAPLSTEEKALLAGAAALVGAIVGYWVFAPSAPVASASTSAPAAPPGGYAQA